MHLRRGHHDGATAFAEPVLYIELAECGDHRAPVLVAQVGVEHPPFRLLAAQHGGCGNSRQQGNRQTRHQFGPTGQVAQGAQKSCGWQRSARWVGNGGEGGVHGRR